MNVTFKKKNVLFWGLRLQTEMYGDVLLMPHVPQGTKRIDGEEGGWVVLNWNIAKKTIYQLIFCHIYAQRLDSVVFTTFVCKVLYYTCTMDREGGGGGAHAW